MELFAACVLKLAVGMIIQRSSSTSTVILQLLSSFNHIGYVLHRHMHSCANVGALS
jgi:hypothetical protein